MQTDFLSPILLAVDPFTIGIDGAQSSPLPTQIINPNRTAMLIDEFRFSVGSTSVHSQHLATVQIKLHLGSTPLTNQFIPLRAFAPTYQTYQSDLTLTWHLARPMYVPPDVQVGVDFLRKLPFPSWSSEIDVTESYGFSIAGRSMPAGMAVPSKIYVPWACATSVFSSTLPFISGDAEIGNPFDEPLNIDYFCGFNATELHTTMKAPLTFQATLSNGKVLARDPTPFFALFPPDRPMMRMRALLQPKEFISVVLDVPQPAANSNDTNAQYTTVGMTGWREMQTPLGALP